MTQTTTPEYTTDDIRAAMLACGYDIEPTAEDDARVAKVTAAANGGADSLAHAIIGGASLAEAREGAEELLAAADEARDDRLLEGNGGGDGIASISNPPNPSGWFSDVEGASDGEGRVVEGLATRKWRTIKLWWDEDGDPADGGVAGWTYDVRNADGEVIAADQIDGYAEDQRDEVVALLLAKFPNSEVAQ